GFFAAYRKRSLHFVVGEHPRLDTDLSQTQSRRLAVGRHYRWHQLLV
ncbi:MAG: hypothetical protein, partial [Olavius algarvensis Gamma 3 endosymbiont]